MNSERSMVAQLVPPPASLQASKLSTVDLLQQLNFTQGACQAALVRDLNARGLGKGISRYAALGFLLRFDPKPATQLALTKELKVSSADAVRLVADLVGQGLATRTEMPSDRRQNLLYMTEKGREQARLAEPAAPFVAEVITSNFTIEEYRAFLEMLSRLKRAADNYQP